MTTRTDRDLARDDLAQALRALERERDQVFERLRSYPAPVTACDEQFNYLLEERDRIARELARLRQPRGERNQK